MFGGSCGGGEQIVSAAREAREERAAARQREAAAVVIQATVRRFLAQRQFWKKAREDFDLVLGGFNGSTTTTDAKLPPPLRVFTITSPIIRHFNVKHDEQRLHNYCRYLVASLRSPSFQQRCIACALSKDHTLAWIQHMKQVLELACSSLERLSGELSNESRMLSVLLHLLLDFTATLTWPSLPPPLLPPLNKLTHNFLQHLVSTRLYSTLRHVLLRGLCRSKPVLRPPSLGAVLTLALRPLPDGVAASQSWTSPVMVRPVSAPSSSSSGPKKAVDGGVEAQLLSQLILQFVSVPGVVRHLTMMVPESVSLLQKKNVFELCVYYLHNEQRLRIVFHTLEASYALCLLANLVHLAHHYVVAHNEAIKAGSESTPGTHVQETKTRFEEVIDKFISIARRLLEKSGEYVSNKQSGFCHSGTKSSGAGATSSQWHPVLGWFAQQLDNHLQESLEFVRPQLHFLWSQPLLNTLFAALPPLLPPHEVTSGGGCGRDVAVSGASNSSGSRPWSLRRILDKRLSLGTNSSKSSKNYTSNKLSCPAVQRVTVTCSLFHLAMHTLTQLKMDVLTGLCYKSGVVVQLWWLLQSFGNNCGLKTFLEHLAQASKPSSPEFHMLILFCDATAHLVTVLDDLEMYEQQKPFSISDYTSIVCFLNALCYKLIDQRLVDCRHVWSCPLFSSAHSLLTLLFRRNSRRAFVPSETTWLIPELKLSTFKDNLMNGNIVEQVILQTLPHVIPHEERVLLFRANVSAQKATLALASPQPFTLITVYRSRLVEDGYRQLNTLSPNALKGVIRVRFVNEQGLDEAGIDQDGVFKEFLEETLKRVLDPSLNLFCMSSENQLYPSPSSGLTDNHLELLEFTGKMLGKALYEGIVVDCPFAGFFLSQVIGEQQSALYSSIDQLPSLDPELYKNLTYIKHYEGNVEDLGLTFSYDEERLGELVSHELRPAGKILPVTNDNRIVYIHLMAHFKMHTQIRAQTRAFVKGFRSIINPEWLAMFSIPELQRIISGDNADIDLKDLRKHTQYYGGFHDSHRVVCWLWDILEKDLSSKELSLFLKFVTSCSKPPLLGFAHLEPPFSIRCVEVGDDEDTGDTVGSVVRGFLAVGRRDPVHRLPTASTCFNLLKLPNYQKKATLRSKLKYAITSNTGFELS
ncbi:HECT domain [Trinorchestia longiramus]|nr:HECT domain [Trinorchestia longiramus]